MSLSNPHVVKQTTAVNQHISFYITFAFNFIARPSNPRNNNESLAENFIYYLLVSFCLIDNVHKKILNKKPIVLTPEIN